MALTLLLALAATTATPARKPPEPVRRPPVTATVEKAPAVDPMAAMAMVTEVFDKLFPAGPEPDPARLAAARGTVQTMFPEGAYAGALTRLMNGMIDRGLDMSEADFAKFAPAVTKDKGKDKTKAKKDQPPSTIPFRQKLTAEDPNFDAKLAAIRAFMGQMIIKLGTVAEPKFRDGMARAMARKFDTTQIAEINAFLATPTGQSYGREMVGLWFEPDVMRGAIATFPEMIKLLPDLVKDGATLDSQIKALEKPKPETAKTSK